jgi:4-hydroxybenzoate polyprenyltransferase
MYLLRYGIVEPALLYAYSPAIGSPVLLQFPHGWFLVVVLINVFLGAAGYVINDYFDQKIDTINRPGQVVIGKVLHRRAAIILHFILNGIAAVLAALLAYKLRNPMVLAIYLAIAGVFWLYSSAYKKQFLTGNIIVALGTATIPLQVAFFDIIALNQTYAYTLALNGLTFKPLLYWLMAFALFAFLTNLLREIVKDIEDFEGDSNFGCQSLPVVLGIYWTKIISVFMSITIAALIFWFYIVFLADKVTLFYFAITLILPLLIVAILAYKAKTVKQYRTISIIIKLIMLGGIAYALVAKQLMAYNFPV